MLQKSDYLRVGKSNEHCVACGKKLDQEDKHPSTLVQLSPEEQQAARQESDDAPTPTPDNKKEQTQPADEPAFRRMDYCEPCWQDLKEKAYFSFWLGKRKQEDQPTRKLNRAERNLALAALFDSLREHEDPETDTTPHLYLIAHLLMKYKIFRWQPAIEDPETGAPLLRFIRNDTDEEILLPDIALDDDMLLKVKNEIEQYLRESCGQDVPL